MILQNWWYTTLLNANTSLCPPLKKNLKCEFLIIGGGMAGLHAALYLVEHGKHDVVIVDRNICGGSSTGKSAGFLTPDSEIELSQLVRRYGPAKAKIVWGMATEGVQSIVNSVKRYKLMCDFQKQDSLFLGVGKTGVDSIVEETKMRTELGFRSKFFTQDELTKVNSGSEYTAGVLYDQTYGINPLLYAQELKMKLLKKGVKIFESTEVYEFGEHHAHTHLGSIHADHIIVCMDKMPMRLSNAASNVYHAQTFLSISEPLDNNEINRMFPMGNVMCWDSKLVYSYYRLTGDNRLLVGGGSAVTTFLPMDVTSPIVINNVLNEFKSRFSFLKHHQFIQYWPGRIDTTKDIMPIVDEEKNKPHVTYVLGCVGLPWAAFCGSLAAKRIIDPKVPDYNEFLGMNRKFMVSQMFQKIFGKMVTWSMNNAYSKYVQRDR